MVEQVSEGLDLAKQFFQHAVEEYKSGEWIKQKDGCEKGFQAAMEALDVVLGVKGYTIDVGDPKAHYQRELALIELSDIDPKFIRYGDLYSSFKNRLHGICFYTQADPKYFEKELMKVEEFISLSEELIGAA